MTAIEELLARELDSHAADVPMVSPPLADLVRRGRAVRRRRRISAGVASLAAVVALGAVAGPALVGRRAAPPAHDKPDLTPSGVKDPAAVLGDLLPYVVNSPDPNRVSMDVHVGGRVVTIKGALARQVVPAGANVLVYADLMPDATRVYDVSPTGQVTRLSGIDGPLVVDSTGQLVASRVKPPGAPGVQVRLLSNGQYVTQLGDSTLRGASLPAGFLDGTHVVLVGPGHPQVWNTTTNQLTALAGWTAGWKVRAVAAGRVALQREGLTKVIDRQGQVVSLSGESGRIDQTGIVALPVVALSSDASRVAMFDADTFGATVVATRKAVFTHGQGWSGFDLDGQLAWADDGRVVVGLEAREGGYAVSICPFAGQCSRPQRLTTQVLLPAR